MSYQCPFCPAQFKRRWDFNRHAKIHDSTRPFQCTLCNRGYNTAAALTGHMQNHKKQQQAQTGGSNLTYNHRSTKVRFSPYAARDPPLVITSRTSKQLAKSDGSSSGGSSTCADNNRMPTPGGVGTAGTDESPPEQIDREMLAADTALPSSSSSTEREETSSAVETIVASNLSVGDGVRCSQCNFALPDIESLWTHMRAHRAQSSDGTGSLSNEDEVSCSQCNVALPDIESLWMHMRAHCEQSLASDAPTVVSGSLSDEDGVCCSHCSVTLPDIESLWTHMRTHWEQSPASAAATNRPSGVDASVAGSKGSGSAELQRDFRRHKCNRHGAAAAGQCQYCRMVCCAKLEMYCHFLSHANQFKYPACPESLS